MTPEDFSPDDLSPGTRIGGYVVRTMLGQGGSSSIYEVESPRGHRFALKMCRYPEDGPGTSGWRVDQRYSRSIACLQLLKGQRNVAELYAHDRYPDPLHGHQYLVQELVSDGLLITDWVQRESPTLRTLVGAFVELAELCGVMASKGICHRDLKPANILVTPDGTPKVIDFENAICPHAEPVTRGAASAEPGTGGWQIPEVCQAILEELSKKKGNKAFDFLPWGDLLSLGVVFHECLTGGHPFDARLPDDLRLGEIAFQKPVQPVRLSTAVPLGLNKVVMKLLEKRPEARYREGAEVANDLRKLLEKVKGERWDRPFKQPVSDEEEASHGVDTGASADAEASREAILSPRGTGPDTLPPRTADTAEPRGLPESEALGAEWDIPRVLDLGKAGAYTLEECLGRGGYGEVYRARQQGAAGFVQPVAIKRLRPGSRSSEARSFVDEAHVLSRLHHENIARVYAFHEWDGSYYLVMEYIEGHALHTLLELARRKGHRFSESVACAVMADVADALHHAHHATDEAGRPLHIVHRDVSPTNILITQEGRVVLVDFGVAHFKDEERIATPAGSTIKGKAPYLSPEQVKHRPVDARSDLFSVGTILVELLTGKAPFGWTTDWTTLNRIATVTPEYVASLLPGVSEPLRAFCQKLLAPHPDQRFATGREVAMALRHHAGLGEGSQSIQAEMERLQALPDAKAAPPPAAEAAARALSGVRRARRAVALAGALMLAVTLVLIFWYAPRPAVPVPSSPPLQGSTVSLRPPEKAAATPVPPPNGPLMGKPKGENGTAVAAGPAHQRKVATPPSDPAPGKLSTPTILADQKTRIPPTVTAPPVTREADGAVSFSPDSNDSDESRGLPRDTLVAPQVQLAAMMADYVKVSGEALSPQHALAALFATGNANLTHFRLVSRRRLMANGISASVAIWKPLGDDDTGTVAVVVDLTNPDDAPPWGPTDGRIVSVAHSSSGPIAVRAMPRVIPPGQSGRVALVFNQSVIGENAMVEILRDSRPEFGMEISSKDLEERKSLWPF